MSDLIVKKKGHKDYEAKAPYYQDCYYLISQGDAKTVKEQETAYLPKLMSQIRNNIVQGSNEYKEYLSGAVWSEIPKESVNNILGEMFMKPSTYKLPKAFDEYISNITNDANGLNILEALVSIGQLEMSRIGLMAFVSTDLTGSKLPKVATYNALDIFNWHQKLDPVLNEIVYDLVELRTSVYEMDPDTFEYSEVIKYVIHALNPEGYYCKVTLKDTEYDDYKKGGYAKRASHPTYIEPEFKGFKLRYVPFVAINASNVDGNLDIPILYSQADLAVHAYKDSALYKKKCKLQTWALLAGAGYSQENIDQGVKADGVLMSTDPNAKINYITPDSESLEALRLSWENSINMAKAKGIQISEKTQVESGIALENRMKNQANAFRRLVQVRNEGILKLFSYIVDWGSYGIKVTNDWITPYMDFNSTGIVSDDLVKRAALVNQGNATQEDFYNFLKRTNETQFETFEKWKAELPNSEYQE